MKAAELPMEDIPPFSLDLELHPSRCPSPVFPPAPPPSPVTPQARPQAFTCVNMNPRSDFERAFFPPATTAVDPNVYHYNIASGNFSCVPATFQDVVKLGNCYKDAYRPFDTGYPARPGSVSALASSYGPSLPKFDIKFNSFEDAYPNQNTMTRYHYQKVIDVKTKEICNFGKWELVNCESKLIPRKIFIEPFGWVPPLLPTDDFNPYLTDDEAARLDALREEKLKVKPYLRLVTLGTIHRARDQGAATLQVIWGITFADHHNLEIQARANSNSINLLRKHGFREAGDPAISGGVAGGCSGSRSGRPLGSLGNSFTLMLRKPRTLPRGYGYCCHACSSLKRNTDMQGQQESVEFLKQRNEQVDDITQRWIEYNQGETENESGYIQYCRSS